MRKYHQYLQREFRDLPGDVVDSFFEGLSTIIPRNRSMILEFNGLGDSEIAQFVFKSHLNSRYFYFMLGMGLIRIHMDPYNLFETR